MVWMALCSDARAKDVTPSCVELSHGSNAACTEFRSKWTGSFVNVDFRVGYPRVSSEHPPRATGVEIRINNLRSRPVRVCIEYLVVGMDGVVDDFGKMAGKEPKEGWCLDALANETSRGTIPGRVNTLRRRRVQDVDVRINQVKIWEVSPTRTLEYVSGPLHPTTSTVPPPVDTERCGGEIDNCKRRFPTTEQSDAFCSCSARSSCGTAISECACNAYRCQDRCTRELQSCFSAIRNMDVWRARCESGSSCPLSGDELEAIIEGQERCKRSRTACVDRCESVRDCLVR